MIYPGVSAAVKYECNGSSPLGTSSLGIQSQPYLADPSVQASAVPGAYAASGESSPYDGRGVVMSLPPHFHPVQGFDTRPGAEHAAAQDESASLDFFPAHKTTPVKRGPFKDQDSREKTALTRKIGSCIRCRMQRIRVSTQQTQQHPTRVQ
jgi:hypothetical protein